MPNSIRQKFTVELGGETLPLRFELQDIMAAEQRLGAALYPIGKTPFWSQNGGAVGLSLYAQLLVVGLIHHDPNVTLEWTTARLIEAATMLDGSFDLGALDAINVRVAEALHSFFMRAGMIKPDPPKTETSEGGPNSGPTADTTLASDGASSVASLSENSTS